MPYSYTEKKRIRKSFGKLPEILQGEREVEMKVRRLRRRRRDLEPAGQPARGLCAAAGIRPTDLSAPPGLRSAAAQCRGFAWRGWARC